MAPVAVSTPQERSTRQKRALATLLASSEGFHSAQELYRELRANGERIGRTTVYNQLRDLAQSGQLDVLTGDDGETRYRRCTAEHHHHIVCRGCGLTIEVEGLEVERWALEVAASHGFSEVSHTVEIFGTCRGCRAVP
jgi:Fur family transcriptional regulator, ferric uptake regulator